MNDSMIQIIIIGAIFLAVILGLILIYMNFKEKKAKEEIDNIAKPDKNEKEEEIRATKSIFKFMEFDTIEDNMIVQDDGKRYLMAIKCQGVNYDLLSSLEKNSVEQGFISFLNTLKFEIQIYVQTRKVNLAQSTMKYRERLRNIELDMNNEQAKYEDMVRMNSYSPEELLKEQKEVIKKRNLYEYGKDVIENTEQMSEDRDLTTKEYYIIVPYYTDEITSAGDYDKREISSMAFSELYTRAQSLVGALGECDVRGKILNSQELVELLFIAYNREQHDVYDFEEYMSKSGFDSIYVTAPSVLEERMRAINEEILRKANDKAIVAYERVNRRNEFRRRAVEERERNIDKYIDDTAKEIVDSQANVIGHANADATIQEIDKMTENKKKIEEHKKARENKTDDSLLLNDEEENENIQSEVQDDVNNENQSEVQDDVNNENQNEVQDDVNNENQNELQDDMQNEVQDTENVGIPDDIFSMDDDIDSVDNDDLEDKDSAENDNAIGEDEESADNDVNNEEDIDIEDNNANDNEDDELELDDEIDTIEDNSDSEDDDIIDIEDDEANDSEKNQDDDLIDLSDDEENAPKDNEQDLVTEIEDDDDLDVVDNNEENNEEDTDNEATSDEDSNDVIENTESNNAENVQVNENTNAKKKRRPLSEHEKQRLLEIRRKRLLAKKEAENNG